MKQYYICLPNGEQYGPLDTDSILTQVQSGQLPRNAMVWSEGMDSWLPLEQVFPLPPAHNLPPLPSTPIYQQTYAAHYTQPDMQATLHAAQLNDYETCIRMAKAYADGIGVKVNIKLALSWAMRAYNINPTERAKRLVEIYQGVIDENKPSILHYIYAGMGLVCIFGILFGEVDTTVKIPGIGIVVFFMISSTIKIINWHLRYV